MGARVRSSHAMATGTLAPQCHKTVTRLSLIRTLNIVWVMTASKIITGKCLINSDGTLRRGFTLKFYSLPLFMREDYFCLKAKTFPITTDCYTVIIPGTIKLAHHFWWNFDEMNFNSSIFSSIGCEWGLPERKYPLITMYNILLYPVFWNANDKASSHESWLEWFLLKENLATFFIPLDPEQDKWV